MTQEQIIRLQELKKLLDAGILTPEEMQVEKAKILRTHSLPLSEKEETLECNNESKTNTQDNNLETNVSTPHNIEIKKDGNQAARQKDSKRVKRLFLAIGFIILLLGTLFALVHKSNNTTDYEVDYVCPDTLITEQDNSNSNTDIANGETYDDDEFAFDPWIGGFTIDGELYRVGSTVAKLNLSKISKDYYEGKIYAFIGNSQEDGTISIDYGSLEGTIKGKVDGNALTVVISSYTSKKGNYGDDYFKGSSLKGQVFRIYYNSGSYSVTVLGGMEDFYTYSEETTIKKN
jgi:hypothetical protein